MSELSKRLSQLSPAKRKLLEERMRKGADVAEPIAVVGMACRFAGACNLDAFWRLIREGIDATSEIPPSRWDIDELYDPTGETPGKMSVRWGGFVDDVDQFDPLFFGISPREAERVDPQQRLLLEVAWEALEHGSVAPESLAGSATGVFVGIGAVDYSRIPSQFEDPYADITVHGGTGNALSIAANRLSYVLDLHGPSLIVDTACSSSLVALHLAVRSLRARECDAALAGGVNLILTPETTVAFSKAHMLSPDGHCRPFDAGANGYVRGEGCGIVVLKRLTDAVAAGDRVLAVVRATAVNQDGRTSGITAPNGVSQQEVIQRALAEAGLTPDRIGYIEAHGTGTPLGDPIEVDALSKIFAARSAHDPPCHLSSVKANIGHTETAAGIASLIKVVLMMEHGWLPAQTHFHELNPHMRLDGSRLRILTEGKPWQTDGPRIAGLSAFGFGGTNAHVIVEEASPADAARIETDRPIHLLALSGKTRTAVEKLAARYAEFLDTRPETPLADVCFSTNAGRSHFHHRLAVVADSAATMRERLAAVAAGQQADGVKSGQVKIASRPKVAFLFTGQGSQYAGMGRRLFETEPVFRRALEECDAILRQHLDEPLLAVLHSPEKGKLLDETMYTQPALFALEYALAQLWRSWGIEPAAVLGHSVGEYAAACFAGVFSLEDGLRLIAGRGRLMQGLPHDGLMAAVFAGPERVMEDLARYEDRVSIAALNGPANTVISGAAGAVRTLVERFDAAGIRAQLLTVSHAFHSPLMEPILGKFEELARGVRFNRPQIPLAANLTGRLLTDEAPDACYWRDHIRRPVQFEKGMKRLAELEPHVFLEVGPAATLLGMGMRCIPKGEAAWIPSLRKGQDDWQVVLGALGEMYVRGVKVNWRGFDQPWPRRHVALPSYPFERTHLWLDVSKRRKPGGVPASHGPVLHPLLGCRVPSALETSLFEARLSAGWPRWLVDHQVQGSAVAPAAAYVEDALAAAQVAFGPGSHAVEQVSIQQAMLLAEGAARRVQLTLSAEVNGQREFEVYSTGADAADKAAWMMHATGWIRPQSAIEKTGAGSEQAKSPATNTQSGEVPVPVFSAAGEDTDMPIDLDAIRARMTGVSTREDFYRHMAGRGLAYGPSFQVLDNLRRSGAEAMAEVRLSAQVEKEAGEYHLHPALGDACFQAMAGIVPLEAGGGYSPYMYLPVGVRRVRVYGKPAERMFVYAVRTSSDDRPSPEVVEGKVYLVDQEGRKLAEMLGVRVQRVGRAATKDEAVNVADWMYQVRWQAQALGIGDSGVDTERRHVLTRSVRSTRENATAASSQGPWLIFADRGGVGEALARQMTERGQQCVLVVPKEAPSPQPSPKGRGSELPSPQPSFTVSGSVREIDPLSEKDYEQLFKTLGEGQPAVPAGIVHLWSCDLGEKGDSSHLPERPEGCCAPMGTVPFSPLDEARRLGCGSALQLIRRMVRAGWQKPPALWLVTRGAQAVTDEADGWKTCPTQTSLWGLGRVAAMELADFRCRLVDLDPAGRPEETSVLLAAELAADSDENQIAYRQGARYVARLEKTPELYPETIAGPGVPQSGPFRLRLENAGSFDSLRYEICGRRQPGPGQVEIEVQSAGLNFSDVLKAMGLYPGITDEVVPLGIECAGVVTALGEGVERFRVGDPVMGVAPYSFASHAVTAEYALVHRPENVSPDEAATIPITFLTAYYALVHLAHLAPGERVLIHAGAGGVGLAAIQIARQIGAEIFATAGSQAKRDFLRSLGIEHVFSSRTVDFAEEILEVAGRRGVDVVLNSLPGEAIAKSLSILSAYGRFLEIGKTDIYQNRKIGLLPFQDNLSYFAIDLDRMLRQRPEAIRRLFAEVMEHFRSGAYRPLPLTLFSIDQTVGAFRYMAQRKNIGKVVVSLERSDEMIASDRPGLARGDATYLITGGLGALGLELARWLTGQGARNLALMARRAPAGAAAQAIEGLRRSGVTVSVVQGDVSDAASLVRAMEQIGRELPPLRGVIHAAGVLDDGLIYDMDLARLDKAMAPKVQGAWNLHRATLDQPLDFFVLFSSVAAVFGSPGQANYAAGNAFLDGLAQYRRAMGLPALSINWGPWGESGMAADDKLRQQMASRGLGLFAPAKALEAMTGLLRSSPSNAVVVDADFGAMLRTLAGRRPPLLSDVASDVEQPQEAKREDAVDHALRRDLLAAEPEKRRGMLRDYLVTELARIMSIDRSSLDAEQPLSALGMDSLMGMELKNNLESRLGIQLPMASLIGGPSIQSLAEQAALAFQPAEGETAPQTASTAAQEEWSPLILLASSTTGRPLFCVHPVGGDVRCYIDLATRLGSERPVYALRARGLDLNTTPHGSVDEMVACYLRALRQVQPDGPYDLCGWSTGGIYAYEMARRLHEEGVPQGTLAFFDTPLPDIFARADLDDNARFLYDLVNFSNWFANAQMQVSYAGLHAMDGETAIQTVLDEAKRHGVLPAATSPAYLRQVIEVCKEHVRAIRLYAPAPFPQPIHLFRPEDRHALMEASGQDLDEHLGWADIAGQWLRVYPVPGNHFTMMTGQNADRLAAGLRDCQ